MPQLWKLPSRAMFLNFLGTADWFNGTSSRVAETLPPVIQKKITPTHSECSQRQFSQIEANGMFVPGLDSGVA